MNIKLPEKFFDSLKIEVVEQKYNAKYIGAWAVKTKDGGWSLHPVEVFYQPVLKDPSHSHYFGIYVSHDGHVYICNAESAFSDPILGVVADDGEIVVSGYRHDYRTSTDGSAFIDGGRDYTRSNKVAIKLTMVDGELKVS
jgi:hypothetical protein